MAQQQTSITDTRDAILEAQADTMELIREVMQEIVTPQIKLEGRRLWATMPDEAKEQFKAERPNEYQEFMKKE